MLLKQIELHYKSKRRKVYNFNKYSLLIVFLRDIHEGHLSLEDDGHQSNFAAKLKNQIKVKKELKINSDKTK